jgi:hypothetical protein
MNALTEKMAIDSPIGLVIETPGGFRISGFSSEKSAATFLREISR